MWPFKKRIDPVALVSERLSSHARDIAALYSRLYQLYELMDRISKIDKRVKDLEKILKSCNITVTVIDKD